MHWVCGAGTRPATPGGHLAGRQPRLCRGTSGHGPAATAAWARARANHSSIRARVRIVCALAHRQTALLQKQLLLRRRRLLRWPPLLLLLLLLLLLRLLGL